MQPKHMLYLCASYSMHTCPHPSEYSLMKKNLMSTLCIATLGVPKRPWRRLLRELVWYQQSLKLTFLSYVTMFSFPRSSSMDFRHCSSHSTSPIDAAINSQDGTYFRILLARTADDCGLSIWTEFVPNQSSTNASCCINYSTTCVVILELYVLNSKLTTTLAA